jgi:hypothetical protein
VSKLVESFPERFAVPQRMTDRKPAKGEASTEALQFVAAKDLSKLAVRAPCRSAADPCAQVQGPQAQSAQVPRGSKF